MAEDLGTIAERHGLVLVLQFGSTVAGTAHERSDVDLAVLCRRAELPHQEYADLLHDLQERTPDRAVDLAIINRADPLFLKKILERCVLLYGSVERLQRLKIYAFKRYQDHRKYFALERAFAARFCAAAPPP